MTASWVDRFDATGFLASAAGQTGPGLTLLGERSTVPVVAASGELDLYSLLPLRDLLGNALAPTQGAPQVVVDLSRVDLLDTEVLKELLWWRNHLRRLDGELWLVRSGRLAMRTFAVTGKRGAFNFSPHRKAAVEAATRAASRGI